MTLKGQLKVTKPSHWHLSVTKSSNFYFPQHVQLTTAIFQEINCDVKVKITRLYRP